MGTEIGLLSSMTQIQKLSNPNTTPNNHNNHLLLHLQSHPLSNPSSSSSSTSFRIMWNPRDPQEEDDSWEVRAFAQDTTNIMGTTWPPRSYTCTFCRREFRSAQALGGHMNVHRRDRARLHHHHHHQLPPPSAAAAAASVHNNLISPHHHHQELVVANDNNGRFFLYHLPNPDGIGNFSGTNNYSSHNLASSSSSLNACGDSSVSVSPTTLLSILPYPPSNNNLVSSTSTTPSYDFQLERRPQGFVNSSSSYYDSSNKVEQPTTSSFTGNGGHEELDLELRLGHRPPAP
ncbi:hypothetical protein K1719_043474 [Acacia pycnantha]|nr:hypothetical protein K1719_043474 [Acacia pycnantha]